MGRKFLTCKRSVCFLVVLCVSCIILFSLACKFCRSYSDSSALPDTAVYQIANVGKSFLHCNVLQSTDDLEKSQWMKDLQDYVQPRESKDLLLVSSNYEFEEILINWLAAAQINAGITLEDILILSLDKLLYKSLLEVGIHSIYIDVEEIISSSASINTKNSHIWIIRCTIIRLLNHWNFNVLMVDIDAIILKDPRPLFYYHKSSTIVGSQGVYPFELGKEWGATLCMGAVLFRSNPSAELFWSEGCSVKPSVQDDQIKINHVLEKSGIKWSHSNCPNIKKCNITGRTNSGLNVTLLSQELICRSCKSFNHRSSYYIWHGKSSRNALKKISKAKSGGVWFLRDDWKYTYRKATDKGNTLITLITEQT